MSGRVSCDSNSNALCRKAYNIKKCLEFQKDEAEENIVEHYKHLLLMMLIKQRPRRKSLYFMRLYSLNNNKYNSVFKTKRGDINAYIITNK